MTEDEKEAEEGLEGSKGERPDFRVVQAGSDAEGNASFISVGGMWRSKSKAGNEFYNLRIGKLKLLVFPNKKGKARES